MTTRPRWLPKGWSAHVIPLESATVFACRSHIRNYQFEMLALHGVSREVLQRATLVVVRVGVGGELRMAKPCAVCAFELAAHGVRRVWYSTTEGNLVRLCPTAGSATTTA